MKERIIIVGAGQAGAQGAISLRQAGFEGEIILFGDERWPPYERPPLSKAYLQGEKVESSLFIRPEAFYQAQNIILRRGEKIKRIDRESERVLTESGEWLRYDKLLLTLGAPPRRLACEGGALEGVHYLRTLEDSKNLQYILPQKTPIVIVGAGYVGLEVAAAARKAGCKVTVVGWSDRVLARLGSKPLSDFYHKLHMDAGVEFRLNTGVVNIVGSDRVAAVRLTSGEELPCSTVVVGIGAEPETSLAADAGLELSNGIVVDKYSRTSDPNIWAAGDCANITSARYNERLRLESVPNAIEQATVAARNMMGKATIYDPLPWFWSDQYDVKLQIVGLANKADEYFVRGSLESHRFAVWHFRAGKPIAVEAVNDPASFSFAKRMIPRDVEVDAERLIDVELDIRTLLV